MHEFNVVWLGWKCVGGHCPWRNSCAKKREDARRSFFSPNHFKADSRTGRYTYYCATYVPGVDVSKVKKALEGLK